MRTRVAIRDEILHGPASAVGIGQIFRTASKDIGDGLAAGSVIEILNLGRRHFAWSIVFDGHAEVDQPQAGQR